MCYRQSDGGKIADWLYDALEGKSLPMAARPTPPPVLSLYYDRTAPAVGDWRQIHLPSLMTAKAMLVICTHQACENSGDGDWVHYEIKWWMKNRKSPPILIDAGKGDGKWIPAEIHKRWPQAQRVNFNLERYTHSDAETKTHLQQHVVTQITHGITLGASRIVFEELERYKRYYRTIVVVSVLLALALITGGYFKVLAANRLSAWEAIADSEETDGALALATEQAWFSPERAAMDTWRAWLSSGKDYEDARHRLIKRAEGTDEASMAERSAKACCLLPTKEPCLLTNALGLAQRAVELGTEKHDMNLPWYQLALGLAEYRNGRYAEAGTNLAVAERTGGDFSHLTNTACMFHVMCLIRLHERPEALKLLHQAESQMPAYPRDERKPFWDGKPVPKDLLINWLAYNEATNLLNEPGAIQP